MANFAKGKYAKAISDRSGMEFPYNEMVKEWNGSFVHRSEFESKHPQIRRRKITADKIAIQNARPRIFQQPSIMSAINPQAPTDTSVVDSGGRPVTVANLKLPGDFAFQTARAAITSVDNITSVRGMIPKDPAEENRKREAKISLGSITVSIT